MYPSEVSPESWTDGWSALAFVPMRAQDYMGDETPGSFAIRRYSNKAGRETVRRGAVGQVRVRSMSFAWASRCSQLQGAKARSRDSAAIGERTPGEAAVIDGQLDHSEKEGMWIDRTSFVPNACSSYHLTMRRDDRAGRTGGTVIVTQVHTKMLDGTIE